MAAFVVVGSGLVDRSGEWPRGKRTFAGGSGGRSSGRGLAVAGVSVGSQPRALTAGVDREPAGARSVSGWLRPKSRRRSGPQPGLTDTASIPVCRGRRPRASMAMIRIGNSSETTARPRAGPGVPRTRRSRRWSGRLRRLRGSHPEDDWPPGQSAPRAWDRPRPLSCASPRVGLRAANLSPGASKRGVHRRIGVRGSPSRRFRRRGGVHIPPDEARHADGSDAPAPATW